jgi:hypothetical protein
VFLQYSFFVSHSISYHSIFYEIRIYAFDIDNHIQVVKIFCILTLSILATILPPSGTQLVSKFYINHPSNYLKST